MRDGTEGEPAVFEVEVFLYICGLQYLFLVQVHLAGEIRGSLPCRLEASLTFMKVWLFVQPDSEW